MADIDCENCKYYNTKDNLRACSTCNPDIGCSNFQPKTETREKPMETQKQSIPQELNELRKSTPGKVISVTDTLKQYGHPLYEAFDDAVLQATGGKGRRHGGDATPFFEQKWYAIANSTGTSGLMYQMIKKAQEACEKEDQEAFERELLGALVYGGMAYLFAKKHGFKRG